jgi:fumarate hydratase, class I
MWNNLKNECELNHNRGIPMQEITQEIIELIRFTSSDLPKEIQDSISDALDNENKGSAAHAALEAILKNIDMSRKNSTPICQDTGTPLFFVKYGQKWRPGALRTQIRDAIVEATKRSYLRPNAVETLHEKNTGNNLGDEHFPTIHFEEVDEDVLEIDLMLKGGGCENVGRQYSLPDTRLGAGRDLKGVRKVVLDAVFQAQGQGCAPGYLGVAIGGDRSSGYLASKEALLRPLHNVNPDPELAALEQELTQECNTLDIGPMGFGGKSTVLGTKIKATHRLPASYFVTVSYMCWAYRHRKMIIKDNEVSYE